MKERLETGGVNRVSISGVIPAQAGIQKVEGQVCNGFLLSQE